MIHIIQQFTNPHGGTEIRALSLYSILKRHASVRLWSEFNPDPGLLKNWPIRLIRPKRLSYPKSGTFVFCGACWYVGRWLEYAFPRRIIVLHNYPHDSYKDWFRRANSPWLPKIEWVFASEQMQRSTDLEGYIEPSPIDLERFKPDRQRSAQSTFAVGRLSRDVPEKHHEDDGDLYLKLADAGIKVRIMGGTVLKERLSHHPLIELLPAGAEPPEKFLNSLDCFLYRTRSDWFEAFGRVVLEAMSCGLPVVCAARGGYTEQIKQGQNGFLFDDNEQAFEYINRLRDDEELRLLIGSKARRTAMALYGDGLPKELLDFYLR